MGKSDALDIEEALETAGSWGLYQKLVYLLTFICGIPNAFIALHFVFSHYEPEHHCTFPTELANFTTNNTDELNSILEIVIPKKTDDKGRLSPDGCKIYDRNYSVFPVNEWPTVFNSTANASSCNKGLEFDLKPYQSSAVVEYFMICDDDWKAPLATSMYHAGLALGSVGGIVADKYGRRPIFLLACFVQIVSMIFSAASWNFASYCVGIFFSGTSGIMNYVTSFVLATEVTGTEWRNFMAIGSTYSFSIGLCIIAGLGYIFQRWRWYIGVMTIITSVIYLPTFWLFPESPRWLAQKGKSKQALKALETIAKLNGKETAFKELVEV